MAGLFTRFWAELRVMEEQAIAFIICETYHAMRVRIYEFKSMAIALR